MQFIENKTFDETEVDQTAEQVRTLKREDIELFGVMSGDVISVPVDEECSIARPTRALCESGDAVTR